jgi:hypothetical protein
MKKQIIYLVLLSLMACKKPNRKGEDIVIPIEEPKKPPLVDCINPTQKRDTAQILFIGKWRLTRSVLRGWTGTSHLFAKKKEEIVFKDNGIVEYFDQDTLKMSSPYEFIRLSDVSNIMSDSSRILLKMEKMHGYGLRSHTTFAVCDDSLYLLFNSFFYDGAADRIYAKQK